MVDGAWVDRRVAGVLGDRASGGELFTRYCKGANRVRLGVGLLRGGSVSKGSAVERRAALLGGSRERQPLGGE